MKSLIKIICITITILLVSSLLLGCSVKLKGTYSGTVAQIGSFVNSGVSYTFSGNKVTFSVTGSLLGFEKTLSYDGTYEIKDGTEGKQEITMTFGGEGSSYSGKWSFAENKKLNTITINGITYEKQ